MRVSAQELRGALSNGELVFYYQPKVAFLTGRVSGAEALIRWERDDGTVIQAAALIPVAEANGLLPVLTEGMFPRLVEDFRHSRGELGDTTIALNISASDLDGPKLLTLVQEAIQHGAIDGERLQLEVTEGTVVASSKAVMRTLAELTSAGIGLSMDDYGTGFSSLDTLNRLPFSEIKMDQSFVMRIQRSAKSATLVKASVAMAQMLGAKTVVEGIESEGVYRALLHAGCTEGQGYWISPPLPLSEYLSFLRADPRWPASAAGLLRVTQLAHTWQHKLFVDTVFAFLQSKRVPETVLPSLHMGHTECAFGQWYYGPGRKLEGERDFDGLEQPHRRMHEAGHDILAAIRGHAERHVIETLLEDLSENACLVSNCLQRLETKLLIGELH